MFTYSFRARYSDCDPQGVVFNANYLTYGDIAITELYRDAVGPYAEVMESQGIDLVVAEGNVRYLAPIAFDTVVTVAPVITHMGTTSIVTEVTISTPDGIAAVCTLRHVVVQFGSNQKTPIPDRLREQLEPYLGPSSSPA